MVLKNLKLSYKKSTRFSKKNLQTYRSQKVWSYLATSRPGQNLVPCLPILQARETHKGRVLH